MPKQIVFSLKIDSIEMLAISYMPFLLHGGLFISTSNRYELGDEVFLLLKLNLLSDALAISAHVVWVNSVPGWQGRRRGIGIQFNNCNREARQLIENLLASQKLAKPNPISLTL